MRILTIILTLLVFISAAGVTVLAQTTSSTPPAQTLGKTIGDIIFKEAEKRIIKDYFGGKIATTASDDDDDDDDEGKNNKKKKNKKSKKNKDKKKTPPGLAKKNGLPPGLAKREVLPPGLQGRALPEGLAARLPGLPAGQERVIVDNDILLLETGTNIVLDILQDVITSQ